MDSSRAPAEHILVIAPQPFYQERGTPIAVRLLVETLCSFGYAVDLVTYHEGEQVAIDGLRIFRINPPRIINNIPIGFSIRKIICDIYLIILTIRLIRKNRYLAIHAIEEAIFFGIYLKYFFDFKLVYDLDSSMIDQMVNRFPLLRHLLPVLARIERLIVRHSDYLFPVCPELAEKILQYAPNARLCTLHDPPLPFNEDEIGKAENLRHLSSCNKNILLYVGNLERYQGVDLVIEAMSKLSGELKCCFVIIGGREDHLAVCRAKIRQLGVQSRVHLVGPRPISMLYAYLSQAQILISPRLYGNNTPMKIYSYLASGKPLIATDIKSHTQVLDHSNALLVKPEAASICAGIESLLIDNDLRERLGRAAQKTVERCYSQKAYTDKLRNAYAEILADAI